MAESAVQYSLTQNRLFCKQLNYQSISSHLIAKSIITAIQNEEIQLAHGDNSGRMEALVSLLLERNSDPDFIVFHRAVYDSGELELAEKLRLEYNSTLERHRLTTPSPPECFSDPWLLETIFSHIGRSDLLSFRRVCRSWNYAITEYMGHRFSITFNPDYKQLIHFMRNNGIESKFYREIENFIFSFTCAAGVFSTGAAFYKAFFVEFGPNIKNLSVTDAGGAMLLLMLSEEIRPHLKNIKILTITDYFMSKSKAQLPANAMFNFPNLVSLYLNVPSYTAAGGVEDIFYFLEMFVKSDHHLRVFVLQQTSSSNRNQGLPLQDFPEDTIRGLFKNNSIESFFGTTKIVRMNNNCIELMTPANGNDTPVLKSWYGNLGVVRSNTFNNFLIAHKQNLTKIELSCYNGRTCYDLMHRLPVLENYALTSLTIHLDEQQLGWESFSSFSFVVKLPTLQHLDVQGIHNMTPMEIPVIHFGHLGLQQLVLGFLRIENCCTVLALFPYVVDCFPNLNSFQVQVEVIGRIGWSWPTRLGSLQLMSDRRQIPILGQNRLQYIDIWTRDYTTGPLWQPRFLRHQ